MMTALLKTSADSGATDRRPAPSRRWRWKSSGRVMEILLAAADTMLLMTRSPDLATQDSSYIVRCNSMKEF
jgi:hypothetical protein